MQGYPMEQNQKDAVPNESAGPSKIQAFDSSRKTGSGVWGLRLGTHSYLSSTDASLFSSSLPVLPREKSKYNDSEHCGQSLDDSSPDLKGLVLENEVKNPFEDFESNAIGSLLPDDEDELLAGIMVDLDLGGLPSPLEDLGDYDFFGSGGGLELDFEPQETTHIGISKLHVADGIAINGVNHYAHTNGVGTITGEHPYGEHPSRTLFVRNINSNVEDSELRLLFEQYGDIRTLYTACKHRGFVMISYYDIRDARAAMRALQNKPLRRRKLDIHFSIPKDNPSEKDINQGTLVVFNLDPSVSNDDLRQIFGAYGEIKEIRETPHKHHHKFIEFYDVRAAEAALRALNRSDIAGKRIKLEPSRPGGARRNFMQQHELEQDEARSFRQQIGSPVASSPPGNWAQYSSPVECHPFQCFSTSPGLGTFSPVNGNSSPGLASILPLKVSNAVKIAPIGKDHTRTTQVNNLLSTSRSGQGAAYLHSHSFPDQKLSTSPVPVSAFGEPNSSSSSIGTLSGPQFLWGSPTPYSECASSSAWPSSSVGHKFVSSGQGQGLPHPVWPGSVLGSRSQQHMGSAPSGVPLNRQFGFFPETPETSSLSPVAFGGMSLNCNTGSYMMNFGTRVTMSAGVGLLGNVKENGSTSFRMMSLPRHNPIFMGNDSYSGAGTISSEGLFERGGSRRVESSVNQIDCKKQYQLDLDKIINGEDARTTLMIKNIPNKYTAKMLLAAIDESHGGTYDFLYLPIDFKNKCNVGYAFINMVSPAHIVPFYEAFNGKKWEKFNSEKVASLAYARIQGKAALVTHFQNSSLMNEDKRCRPILLQSEGQELGGQESFLTSNLNIYIRHPDGSYSGDLLESPKGSLDERLEKS